MDQIKGVFNGNFDSIENIKISPFSRAYTFSDSIYEVVPFYKSNIIAFNLHMQRLFKSAEALNININIENKKKEIKKLISLKEGQFLIFFLKTLQEHVQVLKLQLKD
jgi:D-alanine transaminase